MGLEASSHRSTPVLLGYTLRDRKLTEREGLADQYGPTTVSIIPSGRFSYITRNVLMSLIFLPLLSGPLRSPAPSGPARPRARTPQGPTLRPRGDSGQWTAVMQQRKHLSNMIDRVRNTRHPFCPRCCSAQELCENRRGHPRLAIPNSPCGLCGCKATLNLNKKCQSSGAA